ncbi:acyl-CoA dehydrogenase, middle domain-containing protein [Ditylenchus destructor]|uniref:Acyl-CoA dehydrogenase, middle domain-containing protein n=1 Tax=Ditylenchus destructor TaxID=166010 RepID=A0AAD4MHT9_9BILA|nr:acyl-CoA dehydrogenase, middle domain-containing protein [Ditylenchus destructor]
MSFTPATAEQRFVLEHIAGISELSEAATPESAYGGQGLPFTLATAVLETLGTANTGFALCPTLNQDLWLPKLSTGEWTGTMNLTEPQAGSDVGALKSRATPRADGKWSITGTKIFISFGDHDMADNIVHLVLARTPDAPPGTKGISLFLVPKYRLDANGNPGEFNDVRVVSIEHKMGLHASPTCVLSFGDNGDCVGELIGRNWAGVQVAERATQRAVAYARERIQSARAGAGREPVAIIEHPDVRRMLLRMKAQTMAARALVYLAASQVDRANAGDAAAKVASLGVQVHGGMGYIEETGAAQHFRDARITPIYEGTNGIQAADLVGRKLSMDNGGTLFALTAQVRSEAQDAGLIALIEACEEVGRHMLASEVDDRLAGSYPFLTMLSVAVCGWLMEKQGGIAASAEGDPAFLAMKQAAARFYVEQIVPEAMGLGGRAGERGCAVLDQCGDLCRLVIPVTRLVPGPSGR